MYSVSYRKLAYFSTVLTGFASLCAQVVWQKYLAVLVGSEARSLTLVVAVFLFGLATGYYVFGLLTERKKWSRHLLLKLYGYVELLTAFYIGFFFIYFEFLKAISFHSPAYFIVDVLVSLLALLLPTFLMGASIPVLTATLPDRSQEVNMVHAKVYGWNTLGACIGTLISGFYLMPVFGLNVSLVIAGLINLVAALLFIKNPLKGNVRKQEAPPVIPSRLPNYFYIVFAFLTGAIIISFEVFFIRILHLSTAGARVYNFPFVLALFIGGLAVGSLSVDKERISVNHLIQQLLNTVFCMTFLFWITPYWPMWLTHIRDELAFAFSDYVFSQILIFAFLFVFLFPAVFCMGKLLPLTYALLRKDRENYGRICGYLYFYNTLGTVLGAIGIGYLCLHFLNIDHLFKINIYILALIAFIIAFFEKKSRRMIVLVVCSLVVALLPIGWNRTKHYPKYAHKDKLETPYYEFTKWFFLPESVSEDIEPLYFKDGPNTTVTVSKYFKTAKNEPKLKLLEPFFPFQFEKYFAYSLITNGKGDGNTLGEFSTFFLISGLTWLFTPSRPEGLSAAVVGLGTGISTAVFSQLEDIKDVKVLEISPTVIKGISLAPSYINFNIFHNPKVDIIEIDAFKYFTKTRKKFDIIVSQPSNVWVAGVENLFALEFYQLVSRSLSRGGVLGQWLQNYSMDEKTVGMILRTLKNVFRYTELYKIGHKDILILASQKPLNHDFLSRSKKTSHSFLQGFLKSFGIYDIEDIYLAQIFNSERYEEVMSFTSKKDQSVHSLTKPKLSYRADRAFFMSEDSDLFDIIPAFINSRNQEETKKMKVFRKYKGQSPDVWNKRCPALAGFTFLCKYVSIALTAYRSFKNPNMNYPVRLNRYAFLRQHGLIGYDEKFLDNFFSGVLKKKYLHTNTLFIYVNQRASRGDYEIAYKHIALLKDKKILSEEEYQSLKSHIDRARVEVPSH